MEFKHIKLFNYLFVLNTIIAIFNLFVLYALYFLTGFVSWLMIGCILLNTAVAYGCYLMIKEV